MKMSLEGKHIRLVPFQPEYSDFVYRIESHMDEKYLWSDERYVPDGIHFMEDFAGKLRNHYFCYFVIVHKSGEPAGFVYLFGYFDLRKVYSLVYDYNVDSMEFQKNAGFQEEGCMKKHRFFQGEYFDVHLMALFREAFYERFGDEIGKLVLF